SLWQDACRDKILIVSPAQLVPIAQTVERLWRQQQQDRNAVRIAEEAGKMLEKFMDFLADLKKIGDNIGTIQQNYDKALKRLSTGTGNLVKRARDLQTMGVKVKKTLPAAFQDIDETDEPLPANNATEAEANI
ncbi:MAG: DNA recombination protein RmuC, partial [Muribaculaceae bacterium]|nr:DNA recombination protein RmuC [Muribaculaceae bacterium]